MSFSLLSRFFPLMNTVTSSANIVVSFGEGMLSKMSFIAKRKSVTLITAPCGTPLSIETVFESVVYSNLYGSIA